MYFYVLVIKENMNFDDLYFKKKYFTYFCNMIFTEITQIGANKFKETDGRFDANIC